MANKNKRTKARREKEVKEAKHQKVVEKPIYKRPWIWIALAALVIGIVVPSVYQHNEQVKEERAAAAAEAAAKKEVEPAVWEGVLPALEGLGVTESAITEKSFDIRSSADNGTYDTAQVTMTTDVRTLVATTIYQSADTSGTTDSSIELQGSWICTQLTNEDGSHIYWSYFNGGIENATQAAVYGADGNITMQPLYDYATDEPAEGAAAETTGAAVETTGTAAETAEPADAGDTATGAATE
jgi:hypothetical protein